jgi:transcription factor IIIB 90 kDa subunit
MVPQVCKICSGSTQWDDSANSVVCVDCGFLEDSSQTVFTNDSNFASGGSQKILPDILLNPIAGSTLKTASGRPLYGQSSKVKQNAVHSREMHQYIASILRNISHPGLTERSCYLFDLAMQRAGFRWGRQAKLASGACIAIALNESQKGETMATVAVSIYYTLTEIVN